MWGHGGSFTAVDCCISMMRHNVMDDLGVDNRSVWSGLSWVNDKAFAWSGVGDFSA